VVISFYGRKGLQSSKAMVATCDSTAQQIVLQPPAIAHVQHHRQTWMFASEAGGQLFGSISPDAVSVEVASGPYPHDERSRHRYRSDPKSAQEAIEQQAKKGLLYLGEWHTHAEGRPNASSLDVDAMQRLIANSRLNSSALLMLIVGLDRGAKGMALFTATSDGSRQWTLS
jgi:integrative and conjugative element protein (TIGR02256 family)